MTYCYYHVNINAEFDMSDFLSQFSFSQIFLNDCFFFFNVSDTSCLRVHVLFAKVEVDLNNHDILLTRHSPPLTPPLPSQTLEFN